MHPPPQPSKSEAILELPWRLAAAVTQEQQPPAGGPLAGCHHPQHPTSSFHPGGTTHFNCRTVELMQMVDDQATAAPNYEHQEILDHSPTAVFPSPAATSSPLQPDSTPRTSSTNKLFCENTLPCPTFGSSQISGNEEGLGKLGWLWWEGGVGEFDGEDGMIHGAIRPRWGRDGEREGGVEGGRKRNMLEKLGKGKLR
ncbi:hypothetical protein NQZ68_000994 [Dissostichus eleginoides]|nr:hypothetical protein NQZ68_000994 [Dissostichus eleginoides]